MSTTRDKRESSTSTSLLRHPLTREEVRVKNAFMRTTIDLPDHIFRHAKARGAMDGITLKELVTRYLERGLRRAEAPLPTAERPRSDPPTVRAATGRALPDLSHADLLGLLDEEEGLSERPR